MVPNMAAARRWFTFPNPVNEVSARLVAAGVVLQCLAIVGLHQTWLIAPLAYGFAARVASGPRFSPLALTVTRVVTPRLGVDRPVPGPPKRFAQGIGATLSGAAFVVHFGFGFTTAALVLVGLIAVAATLESVFGYCLGCKIFGTLMRVGVIPREVCEDCSDLARRLGAAAPAA